MSTRRAGGMDTGWRALPGDPLRFLASSWPWRSAAYLLTGWIVATLWVAGAMALMVVPVLGMAEGRSNNAIARQLAVSDAAIAKHVNNIFAKLDLLPAVDDHRRVRAVLAYLQS